MAYFGHLPNLLDQIIQVQHEDHLALSEAPLDKLVWREGHSVLEQIDKNFGQFTQEFGLGEKLDLRVDSVGPQVIDESRARLKG